jgi:hypothetical protein
MSRHRRDIGFIISVAVEGVMAMIDIEYRFSGKPIDNKDIRRHSTSDMESYLRDIVFEMQSADISVKFNTGFAVEDENNMVYINGKSVHEILDGLNIVIPEPDEDSCGCDGKKRIVKIERPQLDWDQRYIEDIPDVLMKNAIAKIYADMMSNRIPVNGDGSE